MQMLGSILIFLVAVEYIQSEGVYSKGEVGKNSCPDGTSKIMMEKQCERAANKTTGLTYKGPNPATGFSCIVDGTDVYYSENGSPADALSSGKALLCRGGKYVRGKIGKKECPKGTEPIETLEVCKKAADDFIGMTFKEIDSAKALKGCITVDGNKVQFNKHKTGMKDIKRNQLMCKESSAVPLSKGVFATIIGAILTV